MKECDCVENSDGDDSGDDVNEQDMIDWDKCQDEYTYDTNPAETLENIVLAKNELKDKEVIPIAREWMAFMPICVCRQYVKKI